MATILPTEYGMEQNRQIIMQMVTARGTCHYMAVFRTERFGSHLQVMSLRMNMCLLYNQRDATYTVFFVIISAPHVSGGFSAHHQELIKLYVQPWVLSCFPAVYRWCDRQQESMTIPKAAHTVL